MPVGPSEPTAVTEKLLLESQRVACIGSYDFDVRSDRWAGSATMEALFGIDAGYPRTVAGWLALIHPEDRERLRSHLIEEVLGRQMPFDHTYRILPADGSPERWVHGLGQLIVDPSGQPLRMLGTIQDITERKRIEERLAEREGIYQAVFNATNDAMFVHQADGRIIDVNDRTCVLFGCDRALALVLDIERMSLGQPPYSSAEARARIQRAIVEGPQVFTWRSRRFDGSLFWSEVSLRACAIAGEQRVIASVRDISDRVRAEEAMRHADKMQAIGQLAGGVAHDFNNQLGGIMGYAEMLLRRLEDPDQRRFAERIVTCVRRSADLTGQLLAFARKGQYLSVPVDVHGIITETVDILSRSIDRRIRIELDLSARSAVVTGDPSQLQNALLNLGLNGRDAMPDGGVLRFATRERHIASGDLAHNGLEPESRAGSYLWLEVSDTGCGMDARVQEHLFEPFFTTKPPGMGTGMGLAAVYGTIRSHHGSIVVHSAVGSGSSFRVLLPLSEQACLTEPDERRSAVPSLRLLIVDDEPTIREFLSESLREDGHEVMVAPDGRAAAELYRTHWRAIDLVILDMVMPGMNGRDCFRAMRSVNPQVRVLLASGYSLDGEARTSLADGVRGFIQKPFNRQDLVRGIAAAMSG